MSPPAVPFPLGGRKGDGGGGRGGDWTGGGGGGESAGEKAAYSM